MQKVFKVKCKHCGSFVDNGICNCGNLAVRVDNRLIFVYCDNDDFVVYKVFVDNKGVTRKDFQILDKFYLKTLKHLDKLL